MARSAPLSFSVLVARIKKDAVEAMWVAGELLELRLKGLLMYPCPSPDSHKGGVHSPLGDPPYMETGEGVNSVAFHRSRQGFEIGVRPTSNWGGGEAYGGNQLAYHDQNGRPWLQNWRERYGSQFDSDLALAMRRKSRK